MKFLHLFITAIALVTPATCWAELFYVHTPTVNASFGREALFGSTTFRKGATTRTSSHKWRSQVSNYTTELDTTADTGRVSQMDFQYSGINRTNTIQIPASFPDPAIAIVETITFDPINLVTPLALSAPAPLESQGGTTFEADMRISISFPASFVLSGTYSVQGPTQSATVPFSVPFDRSLSQFTAPGRIVVDVDTGDNFPTSINATTDFLFLYGKVYIPSNKHVFTGTIDGVAIDADFDQSNFWTNPIPEPTTATLSSMALAAMSGAYRRRGRN